eukprot:gnl/TRDRNA2_/TRDRNA2_126987_c0_seq2.p1 gnl/TRDRNA2_/TRDRNA2_126987_c0~~gnl/TRDRNA2_/TRDRNA2_126987_c0_seq2.p1  ORF type:complete len:397 (-),score=96.26 gnl/TRDRNA2_/TRDRNA2_126987_c0_seq2:111-1301(-)
MEVNGKPLKDVVSDPAQHAEGGDLVVDKLDDGSFVDASSDLRSEQGGAVLDNGAEEAALLVEEERRLTRRRDELEAVLEMMRATEIEDGKNREATIALFESKVNELMLRIAEKEGLEEEYAESKKILADREEARRQLQLEFAAEEKAALEQETALVAQLQQYEAACTELESAIDMAEKSHRAALEGVEATKRLTEEQDRLGQQLCDTEAQGRRVAEELDLMRRSQSEPQGTSGKMNGQALRRPCAKESTSATPKASPRGAKVHFIGTPAASSEMVGFSALATTASGSLSPVRQRSGGASMSVGNGSGAASRSASPGCPGASASWSALSPRWVLPHSHGSRTIGAARPLPGAAGPSGTGFHGLRSSHRPPQGAVSRLRTPVVSFQPGVQGASPRSTT